MRILRFLAVDSANPTYGIEHPDGKVTLAKGDPFTGLTDTGLTDTGLTDTGLTDTGQPATVGQLLTPIVPAAVLCIGMNYAAHAAEGGREPPERPVLFMKTPSAMQHPGGPIVLPRRLKSSRVDYEAELAVVIGKACKNATRENALDYVLGYTCANDVSARDWQRGGGGGQWCRGKTFDTFLPLGPCLVTTDEITDPNDLSISTTVSGEQMQNAHTSDMIFDVPTLIEFLSASTTLLPGTVIITGTPQGVGFARKPPRFLKPGDEVTVEIEQIGKLTNPVVEETAEELLHWSLEATPPGI